MNEDKLLPAGVTKHETHAIEVIEFSYADNLDISADGILRGAQPWFLERGEANREMDLSRSRSPFRNAARLQTCDNRSMYDKLHSLGRDGTPRAPSVVASWHVSVQ